MKIYGFEARDRVQALACSIAYWCFVCRDKNKSAAMGLKTWEYLQSSLVNAAIPSRNLDDFIEQLCKKLTVLHLNPIAYSRIVSPEQRIVRINLDGEIMEYHADQEQEKLKWLSWNEILASLQPEGVTYRHVLEQFKKYPSVLVAIIRLRHEEEKVLRINLEDLETIDV